MILPIQFRLRTIMIAIAALAVMLGVMPALSGVMPALGRYRLDVSARIVGSDIFSDIFITVSLLKWRPVGWVRGPGGVCRPTGWGFWNDGELSFRFDIVNLIPIVAAVASLLLIEVYRRSNRRQRDRRQRDLLLSAATHPIESLEPDQSGEREKV
jgi:hypothetical protein